MAHNDEPRYTWTERQLQASIADLQAEVERLREMLAQCRPYVDEARCMEDSAQRHNLGGDPAEAEALLAAIDAAGSKT